MWGISQIVEEVPAAPEGPLPAVSVVAGSACPVAQCVGRQAVFVH